MKRGYAVVQDLEGKALVTAEALKKAGRFVVLLSDGSVEAEAKE